MAIDLTAPPTPEELEQLKRMKQSKPVEPEPAMDLAAPPTADELKELQAMREAEEPFSKRMLRSSLKALPTAGALAGGAVSSPLGPLGIAGGAGIGAMGGKALQDLGEKYLLNEGPQSRSEYYGGLLKAVPEGMTAEMGGQVAGKALSSGAKFVGDMIKPVEKEISPAIKLATKNIGAEATPGQLFTDPTIRGAQSSLEQSPSVGGYLMRKKTDKVYTAAKEAAEGIFKDVPNVQPSEVGSAVKKGMADVIESRLAKISPLYDDIRASTEFIEISPKSLQSVSKNIKDLEKFKSSPGYSVAQGIGDDLLNIKTLDDVKTLRTSVGKQLGDINISPQANATLSQIYGKLANLEKNSMIRAALQTAKTKGEGKTLGKKLVTDLKEANKQFKGLIGEVSDVSAGAGVDKNIKGMEQFLNKVDNIPDEKIVDQFFKTNNRAYLEKFRKSFPEQFEAMRNSRLDQLQKESLVKNEINPAKLLRNIKGMEPKTRELVFGENAKQMLDDLQIVIDSLPEKMGPSGTPQGLEFVKLLNPFRSLDEISRLAQYHTLVNPSLRESTAKGLLGYQPGMLSTKAIPYYLQRPGNE